MIELAKCCVTCGHGDFITSRSASGRCQIWVKLDDRWPNGYHGADVSRCMVCEYWQDACDGKDSWSGKSTPQRNSYWRRCLNALQKVAILKEKLT